MQTVSLDQLTAPAAKKSAGNVDAKLARLQASLDRVEQSQGTTLGSLEESLEYKARRMRGVLVDLGFEKGKGNEVKVARHRRTVPAGQIGQRGGAASTASSRASGSPAPMSSG